MAIFYANLFLQTQISASLSVYEDGVYQYGVYQ